jgi:hypothetical protein
MSQDKVVERAKRFSAKMRDLIQVLPQDFHGKVIGEQLRQVGTQLEAQSQMAAQSGLSVARLGALERCAGECAHLIDLVIAANLVRSARADELVQEARDLSALAMASRRAIARKKAEG